MSFVPMQLDDGTPLMWRAACPILAIDVANQMPATVYDALELGRAAWQDGPGACRLPPLVVESSGGTGDVANDGKSTIIWRPRDYCDEGASEVCLSPNAAAITTLFYFDRGERKGEVIEADVEINGAIDFAVDGAADRIDLVSALTHELGHVLALDHACEPIPGRKPMLDSEGVRVPSCFPLASVPPAARESTMFAMLFPGESSARTPTADELAGVCTIHAARGPACEVPATGCGCDAAGPGAMMLIVIVLGLLLRR